MKAVQEKNRLATNGGTKQSETTIILPQLAIKEVRLQIVGTNAVIVHAWSEKAAKIMLGNQTGTASAGRKKKSPVEDFYGSLYALPDDQGYGIPAVNFKACAVTAAPDVELAMTEMRRAFHVEGELLKIKAPPLAENWFTAEDKEYQRELAPAHKHGASMRRDFVRLASGVADIRFRGQFPIWEVELPIRFNERVVSLEQLVNLFNVAGFGCGIGEWRPSSPKVKSGSYGTFKVKTVEA